ncbi:MAG: methyltransferase domain-containing protein [Candidatus Vecturithrix sp.]|nr:methyltransferase domain-containing protein [Candidatus Vecturithrix sp.]
MDVGAGYGEIVEAVSALAPEGSLVEGIEPMQPKAAAAKALGIPVHHGYLGDLNKRYDIVSLVHVFSHIPDFRAFLIDVKSVLKDHGEFFLETGNAADLKDRHEVPTELDLPDHLTFPRKKHLIGFLEEAGVQVVAVKELRRDDFVNFVKNIVKKIIGRNVSIRLPYTSGHRAIRIRAKLVPSV